MELYIEGLRSDSCDEHGDALVGRDCIEQSILGTALEEESSAEFCAVQCRSVKID